jgi:hypothetical protein
MLNIRLIEKKFKGKGKEFNIIIKIIINESLLLGTLNDHSEIPLILCYKGCVRGLYARIYLRNAKILIILPYRGYSLVNNLLI